MLALSVSFSCPSSIRLIVYAQLQLCIFLYRAMVPNIRVPRNRGGAVCYKWHPNDFTVVLYDKYNPKVGSDWCYHANLSA